mmetsp:Transcript_1360/g.2476  ORF Transcript_1360/g.2476 Transcript_1360/m.2476 type:complete len:285 (-) Transcript_1360:810-1664(-)
MNVKMLGYVSVCNVQFPLNTQRRWNSDEFSVVFTFQSRLSQQNKFISMSKTTHSYNDDNTTDSYVHVYHPSSSLSHHTPSKLLFNIRKASFPMDFVHTARLKTQVFSSHLLPPSASNLNLALQHERHLINLMNELHSNQEQTLYIAIPPTSPSSRQTESVYTQPPGVVGCAQYSELEIESNGDSNNDFVWYVTSVAVHPTWRRHNIAKSLMNAIISDAFQSFNPPSAICLHVEYENNAARKLYSSLGFSPNGIPDTIKTKASTQLETEDLPLQQLLCLWIQNMS